MKTNHVLITKTTWKESFLLTEKGAKRIPPDVDWIPKFLGWEKDGRTKPRRTK
ncbi:hypothetical protein HY485_02290 [Candidatus Woesearchaeota archaeon]|nr:hypothetical protein [Candidatus Woesearchaeota archaeon]